MAPKIMQTVVKLAGSVDPSLEKSINKATKALGGIDLKAAAIGAAVAAGAIVAVKALADISKAAYQLGTDFDAAYDAIRIGTGATGEQLEELEDSFKAVYSSVPTSMEDASKAIADYNTRLGVTGDTLEGLSSQAIAVSQMLGEDLSSTIESSSQAFQQWGISTEDMGKSMDYVFKVSQATGKGFNDLMSTVKTFGPQLQQLGFSFEQSAAMVGQMEKAGLDTNAVMGALKKSAGEFAEQGLTISEGFTKYYDAIKNARSETEAITIANDIFGKRAGSSLAAAIRSGAMEIDAFTQSLNESDESIMKAMWDTADFAEKSQLLGQQFQVMVEPLASEIFDGVAALMPTISKIMEQMAPIIQKVVEQAIPLVDEIFVYVADFMEQCGPLLASLAEAILPLIVTVLQAILPVVLQLASEILPIITEIIVALSPILNMLASMIGEVLLQAVQLIMPIINDIIGVLTNLIQFIVNVFTLQWGDAWQNIIDMFGHAFGAIAGLAKAPLNAVIGIINTLIAGINALKIEIPDWVPGLGGKAFALNIPQIPMLASGGFTDGVSIAGEAGTEAVISFDSAYRDRNIDIWTQAGQMLGVSSDTSSTVITFGDIVFAPQITAGSGEGAQDLLQKLEAQKTEFIDFVKRELRKEMEKQYV
ncbi:MAG: phage tail tape measure protein [Bacteroidales bacterium]|nr:phage tail tape measure protein [Bacteroidales bacterium]